VTRGFKGSPHIDKTNIGPFYGLAMGDFEDGDFILIGLVFFWPFLWGLGNK